MRAKLKVGLQRSQKRGRREGGLGYIARDLGKKRNVVGRYKLLAKKSGTVLTD